MSSSNHNPPVTDVTLGKGEKVTNFTFGKFQHTPLGMFIIYRLRNKYDAKLIITGDVGEGKTTLAVCAARWVRKVANDIFDELKVWDVEEHAGLDVWGYLKAYKAASPGTALVIDELQEAADARRANRNENVFLSWAWMKLRVKQVVSIGVMPTTSALDKRLLELADVRLHVTNRGEAQAYYLYTEPFEPYQTYHMPFRIGPYRQVLGWPDLDGDEDYERLHEMKEDTGVPGVDERTHYDESDIKGAKMSVRREIAENFIRSMESGGLEEFDIETQEDLANKVGLKQPTISKYKRELKQDHG